ncbi:hypothetical protein ECZU23_21150 [Escherichia coli]|nr:hypothetical protein HMPREF1612_05121 [Escherichia coli 908585]MDT1279964.1 hypothetical protein [Escherichia coli]GHK20417.1 hypothetical protein ECZU03_42060 [Escherichia coli]GHK68088.1 hypothetical protein ECZU11_46380 [Escherichia coli]GHK98769.1 hypothetical protein ECZU20_35190 [Escherichia coli]
MGATIFCCAEHETLFDLAGQWMKQQIKEKAGNSPARPDLYSLIFQLTIYIAQKLSNQTVCFEPKADVMVCQSNNRK